MKQRTGWLECGVGLFVLAAFAGLIYLGLHVSGLTPKSGPNGFAVTAEFGDVGSLRARARVTISGVTVGHVTGVRLNADNGDFRSQVSMQLDHELLGKLGVETSAMIQTQGLLGDQYIALLPMQIDGKTLENNGVIKDTQDAIVLEKLIQQVISSLTSGNKSSSQ